METVTPQIPDLVEIERMQHIYSKRDALNAELQHINLSPWKISCLQVINHLLAMHMVDRGNGLPAKAAFMIVGFTGLMVAHNSEAELAEVGVTIGSISENPTGSIAFPNSMNPEYTYSWSLVQRSKDEQ